jgi:hypothetical protein
MTPRPLPPRLLAAAVLLAAAGPAFGQAFSLDPRVPAGKCLSADGTLLARAALNKPWRFLAHDAEVHTRDLLLALPGARAAVSSRTSGVRLTLWGSLPQLSGSPVFESAVALHDSHAYDLDFTLLRGRVTVANAQTKGPARVWVRLPEEAWQLTLPEPGDEVALELFGRWPRGVAFSRTPREGEGPTRVAWLLVLKGRVELKTEARTHDLSAPPGPSFFQWDSVVGAAERPQRREKQPDWADLSAEPKQEGKIALRLLDALREERKDRSPPEALHALLKDADAIKDRTAAELSREVAVYGLTALDDVAPVAEAMADEKHAELRGVAVQALRHWIGQAPGRDLALYRLLNEGLGYAKPQAETALQLLHSPFEADQPEAYETLIEYLGHDKLAVRELAAWHLDRLTDVGRDIKFDAAAPPAERAKAIAKWKERVPRGELPKPKDKKDK